MRQGRHLSWKVKLGRLLWQTSKARVRGGSSLEAGATRWVRNGATGPSGEKVPRISIRVRKLLELQSAFRGTSLDIYANLGFQLYISRKSFSIVGSLNTLYKQYRVTLLSFKRLFLSFFKRIPHIVSKSICFSVGLAWVHGPHESP